jgi:cell division protein FtsI (penicillin-binding protein 3)
MPGMDAVALLENKGLKVKLKGNLIGKVKRQSLNAGNPLIRQAIIELELN